MHNIKMDGDGAPKLSDNDAEANNDVDMDGAVNTDLSPVVSSEKESVVYGIIDNIIDAAVGLSVLGNCSMDVGKDDSSANNHTGCENQEDVSPVCVDDRPDNVDHAVERDSTGRSDAADSKSLSEQEVSASAENRSNTNSTSSPSTSTTSSPDTEESDQFGGYTVNHVNSDSDDAEQHRETAADAQAAGADSGHTRASREERARRKRQRSFFRRSSSSDSPTSSSSSEAESDVEAKTSRLDVDAEGFQLPADKWKPLIEVVERQYGRLRGRPRNPVLFSQHAGGSVALCNRLTLYAKHEVHEGCVNALHFNESGLYCYYFYTVSQKKQDTKLLPVTSPNVNRFSKFFH